MVSVLFLKELSLAMKLFIYSVLFYGAKCICSFDPLEIDSDRSNISQILRMVETFDKNIP